jgi:glycosyltransferase involved in cell wall biosynthesis
VRYSYRRADTVVAVSAGLADRISAIAHIPRESIRVIHNPVDTPEIEDRARQRPDHPWFASPGSPIIISVGRLSKEKDLTNLIAAFEKVRRVLDTRLLMIGEGPERFRLERIVRQRQLEPFVSMPGFQRNPYAFMSRSTVLVVASVWEGFSNVLVEAMACGTNVVSTDCPFGPAEILENGRFGRLVSVGDSSELASAMLSTIRNPLSAETLRSRAEEFSLERSVKSYLEVLRSGESSRGGKGAWQEF